MLGELFKKLFGPRPPMDEKAGNLNPSREAKPSQGTPPPPARTETVVTRLIPIDLDIGLDIGTSCTKAVLGDREANKQTAVPINQGSDLRGYILPSRVFFGAGVYSLEGAPGAVAKRDLKMRIMQAAMHGRGADHEALCDLTAFASLVLRRILSWYQAEMARAHPNRAPIWYLNVGLPSRGGHNDQFAPIYGRGLRAAVSLVPGERPITRENVEESVARGSVGTAWLPDDRLNTFPEAGAQLASLILSPHRPTGCLLVVDVGAGTMDISTLRIGVNSTGPRCTIHCCEVAPLGVHYLHLARRGFWPPNGDFHKALAVIPEDDGIHPLSSGGQINTPPEFVDKCKGAILPTVSRYRHRLKERHESQAFKPWVDGLPYVLSGGGHRDLFYIDLLQKHLETWLGTICSEWDTTTLFTNHGRRRLVLQRFPIPRSFAPQQLLPDFDRFSVAHGLSLGVDGLMEMRDVSS